MSVLDISSEKLDWCVNYLTSDCTAKAVIVWCRFRRERERLVEALRKTDIVTYELYGGQSKSERSAAVSIFSQIGLMENRLTALIAQQHAGAYGLNLIAATEHIFLSNDFSLGTRLQAEDRSHRSGQKHPVLYIDVLATGPAGQKTVDHTIFRTLRERRDVAALTTDEWRKELEAE